MALDVRGMTSNLEIEGARRAEGSQKAGGLSMERKLTEAGTDPLDAVEYVLRDSQITNSDGSVAVSYTHLRAHETKTRISVSVVGF